MTGMATQNVGRTTQQNLIQLSPLDQIMPRVYTRLILCFPVPSKDADADNIEPVCTILREGLCRTVEQMPFLAGVVIPHTTNTERQGRVAVRVRSQTESLKLKTKDLRKNSAWKKAYQDLVTENWPLTHFDGDILAPVDVFPSPTGDDGDERGPEVMAAQANFIPGGLLLCVAIHHAVMDGTGFGAVMRMLAQNCRDIQSSNECGSAASVPADVLDRAPVMMSATTMRRGVVREHPEYDVPIETGVQEGERSMAKTDEEAPPPAAFSFPPMDAKTFQFTSAALAALKSSLTTGNENSPTEGWISTNDALSALIWSSITRARARHLQDVNVAPKPMLGMANNGRRKFNPPLPDSFLGNVNLYSSTILPISTLLDAKASLSSSLASIARAIRASVNAIDDGHIRSAVELIDSLPDLTKLTPGFKTFLGRDLAITSWADMQINGAVWGKAIGKVDRVRIPYAQFDGLCIVLPRTPDSSLEVVIGSKEEDMERLVSDELFTQFAQVGCCKCTKLI